MRVIKFRAWDKQRERMFTEPKWVEFRFDVNGKLTAHNYGRDNNEQELVIEQFTGLLDKNGKEIYEGDIVKERPNNHVAFVIFGELSFHLKPEYEPKTLTELWLNMRLEVIGNIHESPELLESS